VQAQTAAINRTIARHYDLQISTGALVLHVEPNSPAEKSGLREGDLIVSLAGEQVEGVDVLHRLLTGDRVNASTPLIVLRGGQRLAMRILPELRQA
jgi:S1-C subfamily serine protease